MITTGHSIDEELDSYMKKSNKKYFFVQFKVYLQTCLFWGNVGSNVEAGLENEKSILLLLAKGATQCD